MTTTTRSELRDRLAGLPKQERLAVLLTYYEGLTVEEIAAVLQVTVPEAEALLLAAIEKLDLAKWNNGADAKLQ